MKRLTTIIMSVAVLLALAGCSSPQLAEIAADSEITLALGEQSALALVFTFDKEQSEDKQQKAIEGLEISYISDNPEIASVNNGTITANGKGTAIITTAIGEVSTQTTVNVFVPLADLDTEESISITQGEIYKISVKPLPEDADLENVEYSTEDDILTVTQGGEIEALKPGTATVTITSGEVVKAIAVEITPLIRKIKDYKNSKIGMLQEILEIDRILSRIGKSKGTVYSPDDMLKIIKEIRVHTQKEEKPYGPYHGKKEKKPTSPTYTVYSYYLDVFTDISLLYTDSEVIRQHINDQYDNLFEKELDAISMAIEVEHKDITKEYYSLTNKPLEYKISKAVKELQSA